MIDAAKTASETCLDLHKGTQTFLAESFVLHLKEMIHFCDSAANSDMDEGLLKTHC